MKPGNGQVETNQKAAPFLKKLIIDFINGESMGQKTVWIPEVIWPI